MDRDHSFAYYGQVRLQGFINVDPENALLYTIIKYIVSITSKNNNINHRKIRTSYWGGE